MRTLALRRRGYSAAKILVLVVRMFEKHRRSPSLSTRDTGSGARSQATVKGEGRPRIWATVAVADLQLITEHRVHFGWYLRLMQNCCICGYIRMVCVHEVK